MEEKSVNIAVDKSNDELKKEGFAHLLIEKGDKKVLIYIEQKMTLSSAFDAVFDGACYLRDLHKKQVEKALKEKAEEQKSEDSSDDNVKE